MDTWETMDAGIDGFMDRGIVGVRGWRITWRDGGIPGLVDRRLERGVCVCVHEWMDDGRGA